MSNLNVTKIQDQFIGEYICYCFQEMRNPYVPRNYELESKITQAFKAEYLLFWEMRKDVALNKRIFYKYDQPLFFKKNEFPFQVRAPRLLHYCENNRISIDKALIELQKKISLVPSSQVDSEKKELQEELNKYRNSNTKNNKEKIKSLREHINILKNSVLVSPFTGQNYYNDTEAYFEDNDAIPEFLIKIHYFPDSKILLPAFKAANDYDRVYYFSPYLKIQPLFNLSYLKQRSQAIVIITDSIELAKKNQRFLEFGKRTDITWASWSGGRDAIEDIDWSPLKGRKLYFLLKEHSGMGTEQVYETANALANALPPPQYRPLKYISLLPDIKPSPQPWYQLSQYPMVWNHTELKQNISSGHNSILSLNDLYSSKITEEGNQRLIFKPFIYERTVSLLHGPLGACKTWIAINIAAALQHGAKVWDGWEATDKFKVLYIHGKMSRACFNEKLKVVSKQYDSAKEILEFENPKHPNDNDVYSAMRELDLVFSILEDFYKKHSTFPQLIILDSLPFIRKLQNTKGRKIELNKQLEEIKHKGCSILIVYDAFNKSELNGFKKDWPIEALVKVTPKEAVSPEKIATSVSLLSGSRDKGAQTYQQIEFEPEAEIPRWEILTTERDNNENKFLINRLLSGRAQISDNDIARKLNITTDKVKKLKNEIRNEYKAVVLKDYKKDIKPYQISAKYNLAAQFVNTIIKKNKL